MTTFQRVIKYCAIALAVFLIACIVGGAYTMLGLIAGVTGLDSAVGELKEYSITEAITDIKIEVGAAGKLTVENGQLCNLTLNMGVGELNLTSRLTGENELDYGVGAANLTLIGTVGDYEIEIDKGLGNASVDGKTVSDGAVIGQGNTKIEINGGVGNMQVNFE